MRLVTFSSFFSRCMSLPKSALSRGSSFDRSLDMRNGASRRLKLDIHCLPNLSRTQILFSHSESDSLDYPSQACGCLSRTGIRP